MNTKKFFPDFDADAVVRYIDRDGGVAIPEFLSDDIRLSLLEELGTANFVKQPELYGAHSVKQSFSSVSSFADGSLFPHVKDALERFLSEKFRTCVPYPLCEPIRFTDIVVQRYTAGPVGISAHRDGKSFINLITVIVLEGKSRFCFCDDRSGSNTRPIRNEPGSIILMRGIGFLGADIQPFHFVDQITEQRTTFALRQRR